MVLFILCKFIPQTCMRSHPVELDIWFLVGPFIYFHASYVRTAKALARLRICAGSGSPELSLVTYVISTIISWDVSYVSRAGSNSGGWSRNFFQAPLYRLSGGKIILQGYKNPDLNWNYIWTAAWQNKQNDCAPSEYSGQPEHSPSLISISCLPEEDLGP